MIMHPKYKKCKRYNEPGHAHELTFTCFRNQAFLSKDRSRTWLVDAINRARLKHSFQVWAYVFTPEHAHLLIWPAIPEYDVSKVLATIKVSVTRKALKHVRKNAPAFLNRMRDLQSSGDIHY
jgi:putative transposase